MADSLPTTSKVQGMATIKKIFVGFAALVLLLIAMGFLLPQEYTVSRSLTINASQERVFELVNTLKLNESWSPWMANDPSMQMTYNEIAAGEGAQYRWISDRSGSGQLTITKSDPCQHIETTLDFGRQGSALASWDFVQNGFVTTATWSFGGNAGYDILERYMALTMDSFIGPDFEAGLAMLKREAEKEPSGPLPVDIALEPAELINAQNAGETPHQSEPTGHAKARSVAGTAKGKAADTDSEPEKSALEKAPAASSSTEESRNSD